MSFFAAGGIEQRQKSWYMLFFQDPQAEALLRANEWALWKNLMGSKSPDNELADTQIQNMSREGALTAGKIPAKQICVMSCQQLCLSMQDGIPSILKIDATLTRLSYLKA